MYVKYEVIGEQHVAVPTHFFKVVLCEKGNKEFEVFSFIMPNAPQPGDIKLQNYMFPLDTIQRASGLIIFNNLQTSNIKKINGRKV